MFLFHRFTAPGWFQTGWVRLLHSSVLLALLEDFRTVLKRKSFKKIKGSGGGYSFEERHKVRFWACLYAFLAVCTVCQPRVLLESISADVLPTKLIVFTGQSCVRGVRHSTYQHDKLDPRMCAGHNHLFLFCRVLDSPSSVHLLLHVFGKAISSPSVTINRIHLITRYWFLSTR